MFTQGNIDTRSTMDILHNVMNLIGDENEIKNGWKFGWVDPRKHFEKLILSSKSHTEIKRELIEVEKFLIEVKD